MKDKHNGSHKPMNNMVLAFFLNLFFSIFELVAGILTNSYAIISDSVHDFGDSLSIGTSCVLQKKSEKGADKKNTFGYARYSIIAGLLMCAVILIGSSFMIYGAIVRIIHPEKIKSMWVFIVAAVGVVINGIAVIRTFRSRSINEKTVSLHLLEDVLGWIVVLVGSLFMWLFDLPIIDSIMTIMVSAFIIFCAIKNLLEILNIFLEKVPKNFDIEKFEKHLKEINGVADVHHVHIWTLDGETPLCSLHAVVDTEDISVIKQIKQTIYEECAEFGVTHVTIQLDYPNEVCQHSNCDSGAANVGHHHH